MGIQFVLGLRAKRSRRSTSGDPAHLGSVGENIGKTVAPPGGRRKKEGRLEFTLLTAFCFPRAMIGNFCELPV